MLGEASLGETVIGGETLLDVDDVPVVEVGVTTVTTTLVFVVEADLFQPES